MCLNDIPLQLWDLLYVANNKKAQGYNRMIN